MINFANDFELFQKKNLGSVRTLVDDTGAIWFVGNDVCQVLDIVNSRDALSRLEEEEKLKIDPHNFTVGNTDTEKRMGSELNIINESGLYTLVLTSRKPQAKEFKKWLTKEVIPTIRKDGGYIYGQEKLSAKEQESIKESVSKLSETVKKLRGRRSELIKQVKGLKEEKRHLKREQKALHSYAEIYEDLFTKALEDYQKEFTKVRALRYELSNLNSRIKSGEVTVEEMSLPEKQEPLFYITADGLVLSREIKEAIEQGEVEREDNR